MGLRISPSWHPAPRFASFFGLSLLTQSQGGRQSGAHHVHCMDAAAKVQAGGWHSPVNRSPIPPRPEGRGIARGVASRGAWPHRESRPRPVCAYLEPAGPRKSPSGSLENPVQTPGSGRGGVGGNRTESKPQAFATSTAHLPRAEAKGGGQQRLPLPCLRGAGKTRSDVSSAGVLPAVRPGTRCPSSQNLLGFLIWKVGGPRGEVL